MSLPIILLVDDEPAVLRSLARTFRGLPYEILCASSASEALAIAQHVEVDVILSDVDMPAVSGLELLRSMRTVRPAAARLLITGGRDFGAAVQAINDGEVSKFLLKPWDNEEVRQVVAGILARRAEPEVVDEAAAARRRDLAHVRRGYPGLLSFPEGSAPYPLDAARLEGLAARLEDATFKSLLGATS